MAGRFSLRDRGLVFGRVLLFFLACASLLAFAAPHCSTLPGQWPKVALGSITSIATLALTLLFVRWDGIRMTDAGAVPTRKSVARLALGFVVGLFMVSVQFSSVALAGHVTWVRTPETSEAAVAMALIAYLVLACREELAFRGYPLRRLDHVFGAWAAQIVVALVFAIEHRAGGYSWSNAIFGAFVGSLLFGMAALATKGLAVPIGLHAAWNLGTWAIGEKDLPGLWKPVIEADFKTRVDRAEMIGYLVVFGSVTLVFWWWQHRLKITRNEFENGLA
ncbi:MAG: lysostaphin resistance A-like protein [Terriglobales bacterium]